MYSISYPDKRMNFIEGDMDGYDLFQVCRCELQMGKDFCQVLGE